MSQQAINYADLAIGFGDRVRKLRRHLGMSQIDFAKSIDVPDRTVAAWELNANNPRNVVALAKRIELRWRVSTQWLLGLAEDPDPGINSTPTSGHARTDVSLLRLVAA